MAKFKTRARAVDMLGRQQIAGIPTAISELFKNAHDAYAHFADVDYFRADDVFVLRDDGIGMTEEDFLERWLAIGTESKVTGIEGQTLPPKPKGAIERPMLGEKGIGRLAIAAIGPQVLILTRAIRGARQHNTVAAFINWGVFETPGLNLDQIEIPVIPYEKGALPDQDDVIALVDLFRENIKLLTKLKQTKLAERILAELKQFELDPIAIDKFLQTISKPTLTDGGRGTHFLILPTREALVMDIDGDKNAEDVAPPIIQRLIGFTNTMTDEAAPQISASFRVHKPAEPFDDLINPNSFFTPEEFKTADHHFRGKFDEFGQFNGTVTIYNKKPVEHTIQWTAGNGMPTKCGSFRLNLAYVQGNSKESLLPAEEWVRVTGKLNKLGGLYIYKNGIRVLPYGSSDYDFLELERERTKKASTAYFSYRRMFGYVEITKDQNPNLSEKAGREGFRENAAYKEFRGILKHFFRQMAADFFQESGLYSEAYVEIRGELKRQDEIRRQREQHSKEKRKQFAISIDRLFEDVEKGIPDKEAAKILESVKVAMQDSEHSNDGMLISSKLMEIEADARRRIEALRDRYHVVKPRSLGLTTSLRRDWELYKAERRRLEVEVFQATQESVEALVTQSASKNASSGGAKSAIERALKARIVAAHETMQSAEEYVLGDIEAANDRVKQLLTTSRNNIENRIAEARVELNRISTSEKRNGAVLGDYYKHEASIAETAEQERLHLVALGTKIKEAIDSSLTADDIIEALEEENLALVERSEADVELATLGMAVSVIGHEFRNTVASMRDNLNRLKGWADVNKDLLSLWRDIRSDFDHLDAYLELFTPLQQRLFRKKVQVSGASIEGYLRRLFGERFQRDKVDLRVSKMFKNYSFLGYPSTFYPVFVNLVDNSLYWLRDRSSEKVIQLDFEGGSTFVVSDNGPGIPKRDREAVFERGFTRKPAGRGMGLKISRDVLARENWELVLADPQLGTGTTFKIRPKSTRKGI